METIKYFHEPNVSESLGDGWQVMKKYFFPLLIIVIITAIIQGLFKVEYKTDGQINPLIGFAILLGIAFFLFVQPIVMYGSNLIFLNAVRDREPDMKLLFSGFQHNYLNIVLANLITTIIVGVGFVFLIIPGIIFGCRLIFVPYLVMDKKLEAIKAVETSWQMTKGYGWTIFKLILMSILIVIGGLICLVIGVFPAIVWLASSWASMYQAVEFKFQGLAEPVVAE